MAVDTESDLLADGVTPTWLDVDGVALILLTDPEFRVKLTSRDADCLADFQQTNAA